MADTKKHMNRHLRSARQWLSKAEDAFDKEHHVRGELDLLLAQAELQHAKESKSSRRWTPGNPLLRHGLAFGLAVFVAVTGLGGAYWFVHAQDKTAVSAPAAQEKRPESIALPGGSFRVSAENGLQQAITVNRPMEANKSVAEIIQPPALQAREIAIPPKTAEADTQLPPGEMHKLIRAAAKSLRGQE